MDGPAMGGGMKKPNQCSHQHNLLDTYYAGSTLWVSQVSTVLLGLPSDPTHAFEGGLRQLFQEMGLIIRAANFQLFVVNDPLSYPW